jgi:hypothetical protein
LGHPTEDSYLDLLIVVDASKDIIVYTKKEFEKISSNITHSRLKIKKEGKLFYARS